MYWIISVFLFFIFPPAGAVLLLAGIALNLVINLIDFIHTRKIRFLARPAPQRRRQYS